jgi:hypothetical protein
MFAISSEYKKFITGQMISDPDPVVQSLARIFFFAFERNDLYRIERHLSNGISPLCGRSLNWWWRSGNACLVYLSLFPEVLPGSAHSNQTAGLSRKGKSRVALCEEKYKLISDMAASIDMDYTTVMFAASPDQIALALRKVLDGA